MTSCNGYIIFPIFSESEEMAAQLFNRLGQLGVGVALAGGVVNSALFNVDGGHRAVIFDRFQGVKDAVVGEGTHFMIPWVQKPIYFDIRSRPKNVPSVTGSKDLQNVNITLRILFRPRPDALPNIYTTLGPDYEDRVLPSITNEVLKAVVAEFDAGELITSREIVSSRIDQELTKRSQQFGIILDDISITHLTFGREFTHAVELKQVRMPFGFFKPSHTIINFVRSTGSDYATKCTEIIGRTHIVSFTWNRPISLGPAQVIGLLLSTPKQ